MVNLTEENTSSEGVKFTNPTISAIVDGIDLGTGTLTVSESDISWTHSESPEKFSIEYKKLCLHAISSDTTLCPKPCIYLVVNGKVLESNMEVDKDEEEEEDEGEEGNGGVAVDEVTESTPIKFVPEDSNLVKIIYEAIQECSLLHPDDASNMTDEDEEEEEEGEEVGGGDYEGSNDEEGFYECDGVDGSGDNSGVHPNQFDDAD